MSAFHFAKQAFGREKPHSSITDWVDILTSSGIQEEAYDGIPELVDAINLQAAGSTEASRALRKKLKHGNTHQQYRSLVLLKALVENCGPKFATIFADGQLTDALKYISSDPAVDKRVRKKLAAVLSSWREQFKDDPSMALVAGLYRQCGSEARRQDMAVLIGLNPDDMKKNEKSSAKRRAKKEKEGRPKRGEEERHPRQGTNQSQRAPFEFEKEKPKVLASIVEASQASSNLVNAITLVNPETDSVQTNERVQECLLKARQVRKPVIRYIQLVENEELIGTLIETNERIMAAIETYEQLLVQQSDSAAETTTAMTHSLASSHISSEDSGHERQPGDTQDYITQEHDSHLHPDLQDLNFGPLGNSSANLPPPLRPSAHSDDHREDEDIRGSLSDYSDYSSDEEAHGMTSGSLQQSRGKRDYVDVSDDPGDDSNARVPLTRTKEDDPFADPFADEIAVGPSKRW